MIFGDSGSRACDGEDSGMDDMSGPRFNIKAFCSCREKGRGEEERLGYICGRVRCAMIAAVLYHRCGCAKRLC